MSAKTFLLLSAAMCASGVSQLVATELTATLTHDTHQAVISAREENGLRTYVLKSDAPLRDNQPAEKQIEFSESATHPSLRTGNVLFDGLYAMAISEAEQNSVSEIKNNGYAKGQPLRLDAFETGEKWTYVWTRDLSYSVHLALAGFDPARSVSSLLFKTSDLKNSLGRSGHGQILQDTGSGGSYPVSSDRVVWALGAWETLKYLKDAERAEFLRTLYPLLQNTIQQDRVLIFDPADGLYRGEQSFLDWREQTYPAWTKKDTLPIALSKALSTNVLHYSILAIAAQCADSMQQKEEACRYQQWAAELKTAINRHFYDHDAALYRTFLLSDGLCSVPAKRYDLLGNALVILLGVASAEQADAVLAHYPVGPHGPSVVWPQEREVPIYHNQAIWPFVTAYWLKAARQQDHAASVTHGVLTMQRLAALNLSNMENYDFVSGLAEIKSGRMTGPKVNSRRQLWSVAGYLSMIQDVVFGLQTTMEGIRFQPFVTEELRHELFGSSEVLELRNLNYRGKINQVRIHLPPSEKGPGGAYKIKSVVLNGKPIGDVIIASEALLDSNQWEIHLAADETPSRKKPALNLVDIQDERRLYAPAMPQWQEARQGGITRQGASVKLHFTHPDSANVTFNVYRDGQKIATGLKKTEWTDSSASDLSRAAHGYAIEAIDRKTGNASHLSPINRSVDPAPTLRLAAPAINHRGGHLTEGGHLADWGKPDDELTADFSVKHDGRYALCTEFANGSGSINTGITCAVKKLEIRESASGKIVAMGYLLMPQSGQWKRWDKSSSITADLKAGTHYKLRICEDDHSLNMSYFKGNDRYTHKSGGGPAAYNFVHIAAIQLELISAKP